VQRQRQGPGPSKKQRKLKGALRGHDVECRRPKAKKSSGKVGVKNNKKDIHIVSKKKTGKEGGLGGDALPRNQASERKSKELILHTGCQPHTHIA